MQFGESKLSRDAVRTIKRRIVKKESLRAIAEEHGVAYPVIYNIAIGRTWKNVRPRGRLIGERDYTSTRMLPLAKCEAIALLRIRKKVPVSKIARRLGVSPSTALRAGDYGYAALGIRLHQHTARGTIKEAQARLGLTDDDVEDLVRAARKAPEWVRKAIEGDD